MTIAELKTILNQLPQEYDDYPVIFGNAYTGMDVGYVEIVANWLEISI